MTGFHSEKPMWIPKTQTEKWYFF